MTPIRAQYLRIKEQHPNTIVFFRLGDFYETFDDDARLVARELEITLTSRPMAKGERIPMAGVPYHAVEAYLGRLIARGHKVAVCEQQEERTQGLVHREVVRVVTPGTVLEPALLTEGRNNYLVALCGDGPYGLAYVDVTTGEFACTQVEGGDAQQHLRAELERLDPAECLLPEDQPRLAEALGPQVSVTRRPAWCFAHDNADAALRSHFQVATLEAFGCAEIPEAVRAAGAALQYVVETQRAAAQAIASLATYTLERFMQVDVYTRRNLELVRTARTGAVRGSLLWALDHTRTAMGARTLRAWLTRPLLDLEQLRRRHDRVAALVEDGLLRAELLRQLPRVGDLERLANRVVQRVAGPRDLAALRQSLRAVRPAVERLQAGPAVLAASVAGLDLCAAAERLLEQAIVDEPPATVADGGVIRPGFSRELDELTEASREAREWMASLEARERERTGLRGLKVGYNKVFGYYLEVSRASAGQVPHDYERRQTLAGAERYVTAELKRYEEVILNAQERAVAIEAQALSQVRETLAADVPAMLRLAQAVAELDCLASFAEAAVRNDYVRPALDEGDTLEIEAGRHPVVELTLPPGSFVPNDTRLSASDAQVLLVTGPNMAGKSTYLRQVALITVMAQVGSFVPARRARVGLVDRIFTRVGAQDDLSAGQSTFMVEMVETAHTLRAATPRSLLVLDEIGRGTSTYDGLAIARAVVEYIHNHPACAARTLFATHYHELADLEQVLPRVRNVHTDVLEEEGQVVFLHRIAPGRADRSYGIHVARLAGMPSVVTRRAEEILKELERPNGAGRRGARPTRQLALFPRANPLAERLRGLDVMAMTPIEALTALYELQQAAIDES